MAMASPLFFFLLFAAIFGSSSAAEYTVGDSQGWTLQGSPNYTLWAEKSFHVGDTLLFKYSNLYHDVVEVSKSDYDACTNQSAIATYTTGNDSITIKNAGTHYFLCSFPGHCNAGQKVAITASAANGEAPGSSAAPSPDSGSGSGSGSGVPPPSSGGSSGGGSGGGASNAAAVGQKGLGLVVFSLLIAAAASLISAY